MTNCAVTGAPKLSEKGAARSNSSSVNARTASAASRLFRRKSSSAAAFVILGMLVGMLGIQLGDHFPRDVRNGLPAGDCSCDINFDRVDAGNMVHDYANRTAVRSPTPVRAIPLPRVLQQRLPRRQRLPRCDRPVIQRDQSPVLSSVAVFELLKVFARRYLCCNRIHSRSPLFIPCLWIRTPCDPFLLGRQDLRG